MIGGEIELHDSEASAFLCLASNDSVSRFRGVSPKSYSPLP
jgi:hypothetical protein